MCRPTGTEGLANMSRTEVVRGCVFEGRTRQVGRRVDLELDVRMARRTFGFDLTIYMSVLLYDKWSGKITYGSKPWFLYWPLSVNCLSLSV